MTTNEDGCENNTWPREVFIQPSPETALQSLGLDPDADLGNYESLYTYIGESRKQVEINCWKDFEINYEGYDLVDEDDQSSYNNYRENDFFQSD